MTKIKWKVKEKSTGLYRSFFTRGWPTASIEDDRCAFRLSCVDEYIPRLVREGKHAEITIWVADWRQPKGAAAFVWRALKRKAATLDEAKRIAQEFADKNPEFFEVPRD